MQRTVGCPAEFQTTMSPSLQLLLALVLFLFTLFLLLSSFKQALSRKTKLPPSPPKLPFIGNLHQMGSLPHRSLRALAEKHGPLMFLRLGQVPTLVVSSAEMAQEIMRTHDLTFASRPTLKAAKDLFCGSVDIAFAPYCDYWRHARKLCTLHLLSAKKVHSFRLAREEEVAVMLRKISRACLLPDPVNLSEILFSFANDMICRAVTGNFFREGGRNDLFRELIEENTALLTGFRVEDFFPSLAWLEELFGLATRAKRNGERWNHVFEEVIRGHDHRMKHGNQENNLADVLLCLQKDPNMEFALTKENINAILMDMFAAGTDTTYITLEWTMAELARNSEVMAKLQDELRGIAKEKGLVREEDLSKASYLKAVIKEVLRLHPPVPLLLPRESLDDCYIQGYDIPKRTRVIVNGWAINRDPKSWEAPEEFRPERFMGNQIDFMGNDFQFIPFGAGRRICPGINFAISTSELAIAKLVHHFDWKLPHFMMREDLDMTEAPGLTTPRKQRLLLVAEQCGYCEGL